MRTQLTVTRVHVFMADVETGASMVIMFKSINQKLDIAVIPIAEVRF